MEASPPLPPSRSGHPIRVPTDLELDAVQVPVLKGLLRERRTQIHDVGDGDRHQLLDELHGLGAGVQGLGEHLLPRAQLKSGSPKLRRAHLLGLGHRGVEEEDDEDRDPVPALLSFFAAIGNPEPSSTRPLLVQARLFKIL